MFVRVKKAGKYHYLQIAENHREGKHVKQTVIATLGRLDKLAASGAIDQLVRSAARFADHIMVLAQHTTAAHDDPDATVTSIGPALIFERLWRDTGCQAVVRELLTTRHHHFDVERAVFMTVLHRLMVSGSDRSALKWRRDQAIDGTAEIELQHLYRAMGWLGEALDERKPDPMFPRRVKDLIEEELFARRRDLFTDLDLVFFDTTSLFFTGDGGETLGQYGKSKDHRSDGKQMVLGMVIDGDAIPVWSCPDLVDTLRLCRGGVHNGKDSFTVRAGVPATDGRTGRYGSLGRGAVPRVWLLGSDDPQLGTSGGA